MRGQPLGAMARERLQAGRFGGRPSASRRVLAVLLPIIALLKLLSGVAVFTSTVLGEGSFPGSKTFHKQFLFDNENNIRTWFSAAMFLSSAWLCAALGLALDRERRRGWLGLAGIFVLLSMDESASLHETVNSTLRQVLELKGAFRFGSVIPAAGLLGIFTIAYWRFVWGFQTQPDYDSSSLAWST